MSQLLACIDDSRYTRSVLDHAAWAASRTGATVELLHVLERHPERASVTDFSGAIGMDAGGALLTQLAALDEERGKLAAQQGESLLDAAVAHLHERGVAPVQAHLRHGTLVDVLDDARFDSDLLVMGKRGEAADFARMHLGSSLERVLRASDRPVLVASRAWHPPRRVLVAFDDSPGAVKAAALAADHALLAGLECHVVMAAADGADTGPALARAREPLQRAGMDCTVAAVVGDPADALPAYADAHDVDLLVMGAYGRSRVRELLLGSTTATLLRRCLLPVLVVR